MLPWGKVPPTDVLVWVSSIRVWGTALSERFWASSSQHKNIRLRTWSRTQWEPYWKSFDGSFIEGREAWKLAFFEKGTNTCAENKLMDMKGKGEWWHELGGWDGCIYNTEMMHKIHNYENLPYSIRNTALSWPKWEGRQKMMGCMYMYSLFTLLYNRN